MEECGFHNPVLTKEIIGFLRPKDGDKILDATIGCGGHARLILQRIHASGLLIGIDRDESSLRIAGEKLKKFGESYKLMQSNFSDIDRVLSSIGISAVDGALFDLGLSSYQLEDPARGFSFTRDGLLDMRMDRSRGESAYDIVNRYPRKELERIIRDFGGERFYRRITGFILDGRKRGAISSTLELAGLIRKAVGRNYKSQKIHPATRTFQALRIAVNRELDSLNTGLIKAVKLLARGGRMCVISFHSLEDRITKFKFKEFKKNGLGHIITKKPLIPADDEIRVNPRARSAKLRVFEKTGTPGAD